MFTINDASTDSEDTIDQIPNAITNALKYKYAPFKKGSPYIEALESI